MSYPQRSDLAAVHDEMSKYPYELHSEAWQDIRIRGSGDCKDYAIADLHALLDLGWPIKSLKIGVVKVEPANRIEGQTHAILVVDDVDALDIRRMGVSTIAGLQRIGYEPVEIQQEGGSKTYVEWRWAT